MVKKGNPLGINSITDLADGKVSYVNRQRGAGTRVLFDYKLKEAGIDPETIKGYDREMATHMAVAAAVASDSADAGMGVLSAAQAMGLDFIPVGVEEYDFAIPQKFLDVPAVKAFIEILKSEEFQKRLEELGGYEVRHAGEIVEV
jgi:putative molybdopterin biosynthesis protein